MDRLDNYGDERKRLGCVHCGGKPETEDHVPSRVFLDKPYPDYPPVLPSCRKCNNEMSLDEEYLACFIECVVAGSTDPAAMRREKIRKSLLHNPKLSERILASRRETPSGLLWSPETERVKRIIIKSARGHAAYEHNEWRLEEPTSVSIFPLVSLTAEQREIFESPTDGVAAIWPEVGTRAMQRLLVVNQATYFEVWVNVQPERYRYFVDYDGGLLTVRMVFGEYLGAEVIWAE